MEQPLQIPTGAVLVALTRAAVVVEQIASQTLEALVVLA
jgi:hypothetical protein